jgi:sugar phosphate isomerase/epimerase
VVQIGLQLYTVRAQCEPDLEGALRQIGAQGYDGVEFFQLHGHEPVLVRAWLDAAGLVAAGRHARLEVLENGLPELAEELAVLGTDRIAISWVDPVWLEQPGAVLERIETVARSARELGLRLGFHNHWSEVKPLEGGSTFLDLLRGLEPDLLWLELDLGWIWHAGGDPVGELEATSSRCPLVHVKDYASRNDRDDVPVGEGIVDYQRIVPAALAAGVKWLIVEQDSVGDEPFAACERSLQGLRKILGTA